MDTCPSILLPASNKTVFVEAPNNNGTGGTAFGANQCFPLDYFAPLPPPRLRDRFLYSARNQPLLTVASDTVNAMNGWVPDCGMRMAWIGAWIGAIRAGVDPAAARSIRTGQSIPISSPESIPEDSRRRRRD